MPFSRSLQHSERLRHIESTVLLIECICVLFVKMYSATSLSGEWVVGGKKRKREERTEGHKVKVGLFLALTILLGEFNWLKCDDSFTARSFYIIHYSNVSYGAFTI